jgi:hypothetical protein
MDTLLQGGPVWVAIISFVPVFIGASLLRSRGLIGLFALVAVASVIILVITKFERLSFAIGVCSAFAGLFLGGRVSDMRELRRQRLQAEREKKERDAAFR